MNIVVNVFLVALQIYLIIVFARVLMSWFPVDRGNPLVQFIYDATEPALRPIREMLPQTGGMDFSAMILVLIIYVLRTMLQNL